ncbi:MAG: Rab family GTPase [Candidatus Helarchaeota archaeon]
METEIDYNWKICVIGDPGVGKTTLMLRYTEETFNELYIPTVGVQVSQKHLKKNDSNIQLNIWDIAGQAKFQNFRKLFYEGSFGYFVVFDVTNLESFKNSINWHKDFQKVAKSKIKEGILIGNKIDLSKDRKVSQHTALKYSKSLGLNYIETSAKTGENVDLIFQTITEKIFKKVKKR